MRRENEMRILHRRAYCAVRHERHICVRGLAEKTRAGRELLNIGSGINPYDGIGFLEEKAPQRFAGA